MGWRRVTVGFALLLTMACSGPEPRPAAPTPAPSAGTTPSTDAADGRPATYVALGDSFTAGPGIAPVRSDSGFCLRSGRSWPALLADHLDAVVDDRSCAGAVSSDVATGGSALDALRADTRLVTLSIGGNDGALFLSLVRACTRTGGACRAFVDDEVPDRLARTTSGVVAALEAIRDRAPDARVLLVGYPRILPDVGPCEATGVATDDVAVAARAEGLLDDALARAARQADVDYVSLRESSRGHDACSGSAAWTNGSLPAADDGIAFHPRRAGMAAVADVVAERVQGVPQ